MCFALNNYTNSVWHIDGLAAKPPLQDLTNIGLFCIIQLPALRNFMPLFQTSPAAAGGGVLRDKYRMATKRGLFAVVARLGGGQAFADEISGMA